jgi:uncharacterized beta-barrel protein YwiB (DUF1934 family)
MTEDVLVSVKGLHSMAGADEDEIEVISAGKYYCRNGKHYILYDELMEETGETIKNRITLREGRMEIMKKGAVNTTMTFERNQKNTTLYNTPMGSMFAGIQVRNMVVKEQEQQLEIKVDYELELNYEHVADASIQISVMDKNSGLFRLN